MNVCFLFYFLLISSKCLPWLISFTHKSISLFVYFFLECPWSLLSEVCLTHFHIPLVCLFSVYLCLIFFFVITCLCLVLDVSHFFILLLIIFTLLDLVLSLFLPLCLSHVLCAFCSFLVLPTSLFLFLFVNCDCSSPSPLVLVCHFTFF